ncbi:hypothetical protein [Corynebacterium sp.]|uniref:hypothetical protein n=1 Tax=Corynebacterium sp. TaxID=1720 RepID=UPI0026DD629F|nr:hypothetical protein [Corynebacterium sp.]MDO4609886.1 hypothetical protein [Corynebacterium sp.]
MTDQANDTTNAGDAGEPRRDRSLMDLVTTPFYAWIGAGAKTVEMLGEIGERVREEERSRSERSREKARQFGGQAADQSREAFLRAVDAAQEAFNAALQKAQAGGDRAFGASRGLPDGIERGLGQLQPDQLRTLADGYLEAASALYSELAARGAGGVGDVRSGARGAPAAGAVGVVGAGEVVDGGEGPARRPIFPGADLIPGAERVGEVADRLREAGDDLRRRAEADAEAGRAAVQGNAQALLRQAADVTESLLGALRGDRPAPSTDAEPADDTVTPRPAGADADAVESEEDERPTDGGAQ